MMETVVESSLKSEKGCGSVTVSIAGISIQTVSLDPLLRLKVTGATSAFVAAEETAQVQVSAAWGELDAAPRGEMIFDSGGIWRLFRQDEKYLFRFVTPLLGATPYKQAAFNRDFTRGEVIMHRPYFATEHALYPLDYPLDELLMLHLLAQGRGVELHSCGVLDEDGAGLLFMGQSGAGKTTTARLWETHTKARILSDDRIILRRTDEQMRMYGTPWHGEGELAAASSAPLKAIFILRHGTRNHLQPLSRVAAAAQLFSCSFPTFYDAAGLDFTLAFLDALTGAVPVYELSFVPDAAAIDFVRQ